MYMLCYMALVQFMRESLKAKAVRDLLLRRELSRNVNKIAGADIYTVWSLTASVAAPAVFTSYTSL